MDGILTALRDLDKRRLSIAELGEVAKLYNVKARIWQVGIPLRKIDGSIYQRIRDSAVEAVCHKGGGTVDDLCREIERLIDEGRCGLGKNTYLPKNKAHPRYHRGRRSP